MKEFIVEFVKLNLTHLVGSQKIYESNQYKNNYIPSNKITYESTLKKNRQLIWQIIHDRKKEDLSNHTIHNQKSYRKSCKGKKEYS